MVALEGSVPAIAESRYAIYDPSASAIAWIEDGRIDSFTERHKLVLSTEPTFEVAADVERTINQAGSVAGVLVRLEQGIPGFTLLRLMRRLMRRGLRVGLYWQAEDAVEIVDDLRLSSYWRHWLAHRIYTRLLARGRLGSVAEEQITTRVGAVTAAARHRVSTTPFKLDKVPSPQRPLAGTGVYLRTDYWTPILSGGSYGHTCFQARALARTTESFIVLLANRFPLLDELGVRQVVIRPEGLDTTELSLLRASDRYYEMLRPAIEILSPAFIFERACLGNIAAARICGELGIPYIVEYNGSELSMKRSFDKTPYTHENLFLEAEQYQFEQATLISVVSDAVRDDVVRRGIDPRKVLVNWNAVDLDIYHPLPDAERTAVRAELGFTPADRVVCFIGTYGGWHGIDVLAASLHRIRQAAPAARFLLIGDGNLKHLVNSAIETHKLHDVVVDVGRVPQARGARLMAAADIFVAPHSSHMVDSRFFGSPTKLFEYMAYGVGIVASDLEQIGDILSPSLRVGQALTAAAVKDHRGILCQPDNVDEFVAATAALANDPALSVALGRNAIEAAKRHFTWDVHAEKLWHFASNLPH